MIEHLQDRLHTMNEIWRICKPNAKVDIRVPSTDGRGAFQDPTHVSFWNINSFLYYCVDFPPYLELCKRYGFRGAFKVLRLAHEESTDEVIHVRAELLIVKPQTQLTIDHNLNANSTGISVRQQESSNKIATNISKKRVEGMETTTLLHTLVEKYQQDPTNRIIVLQLRQIRKEITEQLLCLSANQLENAYLGDLGEAYRILLNSSIRDESLTDAERSADGKIVGTHISEQLDNAEDFKYLFISALYRRADQLPFSHDISHVPEWFLDDYLKFIFYSPRYFQELGEADRYCQYIQQWLAYFHTSIFSDTSSSFWRERATQFLSVNNFIPLYFNGANLKDIYIKRAEIIEFVLKSNGSEIDFEFDDRDIKNKKIRLGILSAHYTPTAETFAALPVYEYISRDFEVILYSLESTNSQLEKYCQSCANSFKVLPTQLVDQVEPHSL